MMFWDDFGPVIVLGVFGVFMVVCLGLGINYSEYINREAEYGQLRRDVQRVTAAESEDVIGQATQANQTIALWQRWNRVPVIQLVIPNGWDRMMLIEIPER